MIFYTGSYTQQPSPAPSPAGEGIGCFEFDDENGNIRLLRYTPQRNPSYLTISADRQYLYAVEELTEDLLPKVISYRIGENGYLTLINEQPLLGDFACHMAVIQGHLMVANYLTGNTQSFPIINNGGLGPCAQNIQHTGAGPNKDRQERAHAHMVYPFDSNKMFVVDLGIDKAKAYSLDKDAHIWQPALQLDMAIVPGAGARHMTMDISQSYAYISGELSGEIYIFKKQGGRFEMIQKISLLPEGFNKEFGAAAIRLHPNGKFLYASNRGPDTISVFRIDPSSGQLSLVSHQSSGGKTPRDFNIDPSGNWLIAANQDSDSMVVFRVNGAKGTLEPMLKADVLTPVNICWL